MRVNLPRPRTALALALIAGTLAGCYTPGGRYASRDQFTYKSTTLQPQTITVFDARTNEAIWTRDVPVGKKLVIRFFDSRGSGEGNYPALMRWEIMEEGKYSGGLDNELAVPMRDSRRVEVTLRDAPEYPESASGDDDYGVIPAFTPPAEEQTEGEDLPPPDASEPEDDASTEGAAIEPAMTEIRIVDGIPQVEPMMVRTGDFRASVLSSSAGVTAPEMRGVTVPIKLLSEGAATAATVAAVQARQAKRIAGKLETLMEALSAGASASVPFAEPFGVDVPARDLPDPPGKGSIAQVTAEPQFFDEFGLYPDRIMPFETGLTASQAGPADAADLPLPTGTPPEQIRPEYTIRFDTGDLLDD